MKWIPETRTVELTQRNLSALLAKLDDPSSVCTLFSPCWALAVHAVDDGTDTEAAAAAALEHLTNIRHLLPDEPTVVLARAQLVTVAGTVGAALPARGIRVVSVPDSAHYADRQPGMVVMPTSGELY